MFRIIHENTLISWIEKTVRLFSRKGIENIKKFSLKINVVDIYASSEKKSGNVRNRCECRGFFGLYAGEWRDKRTERKHLSKTAVVNF